MKLDYKTEDADISWDIPLLIANNSHIHPYTSYLTLLLTKPLLRLFDFYGIIPVPNY